MFNQPKKARKYCIVPCCASNSIKMPEKIFIRLPGEQKRRSLWLSAIHRHPADFSTKTCAFICEDHFNLEYDMLNYEEYKSGIGKVRMRSDIMPHIFSEEWRQQSLLEPVESAMPKRRASKSYKNRYTTNYTYLPYDNEPNLNTGDFDDIDSMTCYDEVEYVYVKPDTTDDMCDMEMNETSEEGAITNNSTESEVRDNDVDVPSVPNMSELDEKVRNIIEQQREQIEQEKLQAKDGDSPDNQTANENNSSLPNVSESAEANEKCDSTEQNNDNVTNDTYNTNCKNEQEQYVNYPPSDSCQTNDTQPHYQNNQNHTDCFNSDLNESGQDYSIKNEFADSFLNSSQLNDALAANQLLELPEISRGLPDLSDISQLPEMSQLPEINQLPEIDQLRDVSHQLSHQLRDASHQLTNLSHQLNHNLSPNLNHHLPEMPRPPHGLPGISQISNRIPEMPHSLPEITHQLPELQNYFPAQTSQPNGYANGYMNQMQNQYQTQSALDYATVKSEYNYPTPPQTNEPYQNRYYNGFRGGVPNGERISQFPYPTGYSNYNQNSQIVPPGFNNSYYQQPQSSSPGLYQNVEKPRQEFAWPNQAYQNMSSGPPSMQNYHPDMYPNQNATNLVPRSPDLALPPYLDEMGRPTNQMQWFKCDMCNQSFMGKYALYRHYKTHTEEQQPYRCRYCWKTFKESASLFVHERNFHTDTNPYRCNVCTRTFLYSSNLQYHLLTHRNY